MSYFERPDSPPPREPSPEPVHTPLPSPHLRARDKRRNNLRSPLAPPGLAPPRTVQQSRSFDHINRDALYPTLRRRTRSSLEPSASPKLQSASLSPPSTPTHRRTTSVSISHSPPSTPSRSAIPPVPPLPGSARTSPVFKPSLRTAVTPIYLPDLHELSPVAQRTSNFANLSVPTTPAATEKKSIKRLPSLFSISSAAGSVSSKADSSSSTGSSPAPLQEKEPKPKSTVAMTCLKFFTMHRHSSNRNLRSSVTQ
ncbi:hypothetical protein DFP72DRAFT_602753 [Ephemerocybe angulata]|uniref:Uncharacterized protein n=1 Tax=Ephemerocybe angulata TaxID=980116 RepID=A0A8H6MEP6_9AGAR|nr:hypothetical protein DFP72DRAFT_602753 [Tulosesus angulatus]